MRNTLTIQTPLGNLVLVADQECIVGVSFTQQNAMMDIPRNELSPVLASTKDSLEAYFAGKLRDCVLPLAPQGTVFQRKVWNALQTIPYGETISYRELAQAVGCSRGFQAVGQANGRNPIAILIPCHRVIQTDGALGGYAGGVHRKAWLLAHEQTYK